jgi:CubicO group peptidase (beta-lactamase class C family)
VRQIAATDAASDTTNWVQSIAVARHGTLVLDESFFAFDRERLHDLRSASKSFVSVLLGAEMLRGTPVGPASRVYGLFAAAGPFAHPDPRKAALTLAVLMTHTSGLDADDNRDDSPGNEEHMQSQRSQPDWYRYTLDLPMIHDPGSTWAYSSAGMNLAGGAIGRATHAWLPWLVDRDIAAPLGITRYAIQLTPTGDAYMGGGMYLRPRDVLKLGQMMLDRGAWNGHAIVSPAWVDSSTVSRIAGWADSHEGYAWHLYTLVSGGRGHREIEANGNGGQILMILPELDLTVMITAGNYGSYRISRKCRDDLVARILIPAIRR